MNRRNFIKSSGLAVAGSYLFTGLPLHAVRNNFEEDKHVVLCIVAGLSKKDFPLLLANRSFSGYGETFNMQYNGYAAGHRLALESILNGRYLQQAEAGKRPLTESVLFTHTQSDSKKYLITSNRDFLLTGSNKPSNTNTYHISHLDGSPINEDIRIAHRAACICQYEAPRLLVTHFMGADVAHGQTTLANANIKTIADGLQLIWDSIIENQRMAKNTLFVVMPDFGRNSFSNSISDVYGEKGTDHSISDEGTKNISCLIASTGKDFSHKAQQKNITIESTDIAEIIMEYLNQPCEKFADSSLLNQA